MIFLRALLGLVLLPLLAVFLLDGVYHDVRARLAQASKMRAKSKRLRSIKLR